MDNNAAVLFMVFLVFLGGMLVMSISTHDWWHR
jgi:hypothetical protein